MSPIPIPVAAHRIAGFSASRRLLGRLRGLVARRPYAAGSLVAHGLLAGLLLQVPGLGEGEHARAAAATAARSAQHQVERTQARELERRVDRIQAIQHALGADDVAPATPGSGTAALAARAQALAASIETWQRRTRAAALAHLTGMSPAEATRRIDAEDAPARQPPPPGESPTEAIARLERRANTVLAGRRAQLETQRDGMRVTSSSTPPAPRAVAPGVTDQAEPAAGIPRSMLEQLASMIRLGSAQGRVGVVGTEGGQSVNPEGVKGVAGGRVVHVGEPEPFDAFGDGAPVTLPGGRVDLTGTPPDGRHSVVAGVDASANATGGLHTAAGRVFGAGGAYATRVYLDSWYVIGPFAGRGDDSLRAPLPPEEDVDLDAAYPGLDGRVVSWRYVSRGFYPFLPPDRAENAVYYAFTELRVDADVDAWLSIAADDDSMLWLDGRLVWVGAPGDKPWYHPPYYLRDELVASLGLVEGQRRVHLARGVHRLLLKLCNRSEHTFFSVVVAP